MLSGLKLINLPPSQEFEQSISAQNSGNVFILRTCQRTLLLGFNEGPKNLISRAENHHQNDQLEEKDKETLPQEEFTGSDAYEFLLETICGLKSRILGENEIVHQFKEAYSQFLEHSNPNRHVQKILEKLFKDAKKIRTKHLREIGLQTYAGIVRKILNEKLLGADLDTPILILGSGQLAEDIIKICYRKFNLTICARNENRVEELISRHSKHTIHHVPWFQPEEIAKYPIIINTIGTDDILFDHKFFQSWKVYQKNTFHTEELFIDLSEPSPIESHYQIEDGLWRLQDIFAQGEKLSKAREDKLKEAQKAIQGVCETRAESLTFHMPFGWEELQFA
ncbi:MAG: hypothetical protein CME63_16705 [Halobacteriovoraceae bacterium]|nr:hypothetical protein [Halobacteriovoraceae bacterium]|tara:strand:- start:93570 stop:94580 length:1011 start_codon:yes stop_codon:yes gene_type:complete